MLPDWVRSISNTLWIHMWLVELPNPNKMEQCWECIFLKVYTQVITKIASKFFFTFPPLRKPRLSKMASIKTNKIKKRTPLHNINFWKLTTLLFCPKRFFHSKGPKNAICLWLSHDMKHCTFNNLTLSDFPFFSYTRVPSFMSPIHFWCSP